jgi:hypothetical protein
VTTAGSVTHYVAESGNVLVPVITSYEFDVLTTAGETRLAAFREYHYSQQAKRALLDFESKFDYNDPNGSFPAQVTRTDYNNGGQSGTTTGTQISLTLSKVRKVPCGPAPATRTLLNEIPAGHMVHDWRNNKGITAEALRDEFK